MSLNLLYIILGINQKVLLISSWKLKTLKLVKDKTITNTIYNTFRK